jgi:hypothetical protein
MTPTTNNAGPIDNSKSLRRRHQSRRRSTAPLDQLGGVVALHVAGRMTAQALGE